MLKILETLGLTHLKWPGGVLRDSADTTTGSGSNKVGVCTLPSGAKSSFLKPLTTAGCP